jgi:DNA-binding CsgD family transcriptional regulator
MMDGLRRLGREAAKRRARIIREVRRGKSFKATARKLGLDEKSLWQFCARAGLRFGLDGEVGVQAEQHRAYRPMALAVARGATTAEAARTFRVSKDTVRRACKETGVPLRVPESVARARSLKARRSLRPRARELIATLSTEKTRRIGRLLLTTDLPMSRIGRRYRTPVQWVHVVWTRLERAGRSRSNKRLDTRS